MVYFGCPYAARMLRMYSMITEYPTLRKATLVIPACNEAEVIVHTLALFRGALDHERNIDWTIVVADNGSTDGTQDAVLGVSGEHIQLLRIKEKGKGNAVRAAFAKADGDIALFTDADLPILPEEIIAAVKLIAEGVSDVVVGSRLLPQSKMPGREWWRTWSSLMFNLFARLIVGVHVSDTQCPLKVMNAKGIKVMLATKEPTWFFDLEFLALAERLALCIKEIPVVWDEHRYPKRKSKLAMLDSIRAITAMFRIRKRLSMQVPLLE